MAHTLRIEGGSGGEGGLKCGGGWSVESFAFCSADDTEVLFGRKRIFHDGMRRRLI